MQVPRWVVYAGAATIVVLIAVVSFLIGRGSRGHRSEPALVAQPAAPQPAPAPAAVPQPVPSAPSAPPAPPVTTFAAPEPAAPARPAPSEPPPSPRTEEPAASPPRARNADAIRAYFTSVAAIQTVAATGDSVEMANQVLSSAMSGDRSGFDAIVKAASDGAAKARALHPPPECRDYHERLLTLLDDGVRLMTGLRNAIGGDTGALTAIAANGSALQARADALAADERSIKARAGI